MTDGAKQTGIPETPKPDLINEIASELNSGWTKYSSAFGQPPHGTVKQFGAMLCFTRIVERIALLEQQLEAQRAQLESSELRLKGLAAINQSAGEEIRELREQVERLTRPVSQREWLENTIQVEAEHVGTFMAERLDIDDIIHARSTEQPKETP
jgi:hypothetical protein